MNKLTLFLLLCFLQAGVTHAQKLIKVVYVKDGSITKIAKEAEWLLAFKKVDDGFERNDYRVNGPLKRVKTFKDSSQKILHGRYCEYNTAGHLILMGYYKDNEKWGTWTSFNDSAKVISTERFGTVKKDTSFNDLKNFTPDHEGTFQPAIFKGGKAARQNFIFENLNTEIATNKLKDEKVVVGFTIAKTGMLKDVFLFKSEYFAFDQEALRVINKMPAWTPASFNGKPIDQKLAQAITVFDL